jgi:hypothetical protein
VDYVSEVVIEGFVNAIIATIKYLRQQIDPELIAKLETTPLLEVQLELIAPDIVWKPDLEDSAGSTGVRDMFKNWIMSFLEIATLVKRLDIGEGKLHYRPSLDLHFRTCHLHKDLCFDQETTPRSWKKTMMCMMLLTQCSAWFLPTKPSATSLSRTSASLTTCGNATCRQHWQSSCRQRAR